MKINKDYINRLVDSENVENGLYIVATPIGNLGDITLRALNTLSCVDLILCEDTRISKKLINKYGVKTKLKPFHKFNSKKSIPNLINKLKSGISIAIISDSGTPTISDPGSDLVLSCNLNKINVFSLPGPSAPILSITLSNFSKTSFSFRGFFWRNKKERVLEIDFMKKTDSPVIFFESPKRILSTIKFINSHFQDCNITLTRELTKKHEEIINAKSTNLVERLAQKQKILGEITFIVEPPPIIKKSTASKKQILAISNKLSESGLNISEISKIISKDYNISRREIYQILIKNKD